VHDEELLGQLVLAHDRRDVAGDRVDVVRLHRADLRAGHGPGRVPLGVEREADVGLAQPAVEVARLGQEVGVAWLDVEHQQRLRAPRGGKVAADNGVALARAVQPVHAWVVVGDVRQQLEGE
jgi:hypothetical protein